MISTASANNIAAAAISEPVAGPATIQQDKKTRRLAYPKYAGKRPRPGMTIELYSMKIIAAPATHRARK
jgi:hypothetical protein